MSAFLRLAHQLLTVLLGLTVLVLMIPVTLQIGSRFFEWIPNYMWTEEMSRFCFIWMVLIGATVGVREGLHFDVDIWENPGPGLASFLRWSSRLLIMGFAGVVLYWGIEFTQFGWNQTSELADLPMWMIFIAWPVAGFFWIAFLIEKMLIDSERDDQQGMHI
jgi:TRAP-type C4-dicarboxylate transport system permease small subunit